MPIHGGAMLLHFPQQVGRIWRSDSLRRKMTTDVEVGRVFLLLDDFMMTAGIFEGVLLCPAVLIQDSIARFKLLSDPRDILVHDAKCGLVPGQFLPGRSTCFSTAQARARDFCAFFRETDTAGAD